ncbi:thioredoxin family protein [Aestuariibaculum suncheonense]|uniref:DUF255 domain-containing protein n=1 Tax=Aestuariibaculum suncheonense TaxID=1028745 RepID=A0A8J6UAG8_9FLAO|nr:DUF255 domain-containing protein [Aestuariibaculum suncheonense]MBD0834392.1 DUF255 domain-containing protein [Aestuariibaculum suncheonense]
MKKSILSFLTFILIGILKLSAQGIEFQHISLEEALKKAETENKLVFVDFYTAWCAPCKIMNRDVFPLSEVGEVYNKHYISIKLDAEKEGAKAAAKYKVNSFPTFLYLESDGSVALKDTGRMPTADFISKAEQALASIGSAYSLEKLKEDFPNKQNDERFLKIYLSKMDEYGQDLTEGFNAWLKVQTEIEESSMEMFELLSKNTRYIVLGEKADQILKENYEAYQKAASPWQTKMLSRLKPQILNNTKKEALKRRDAELFKAYMESYKTLPEVYVKDEELINSELTYYVLINDNESYKDLIESYMDSLMHEKLIREIQEDDLKSYNRYKLAYEKDPIPARKAMVEASEEGLKATKILKDIAGKGTAYLQRVSSKKEYETLNSWIDYGYELKPESCYIDDLRSRMYIKQNKVKKALKFKERAIDNWPRSDKKFVNKEYELEQLRKSL